MLQQLLTADLFSFAIAFVRIGAAMMLIPGIGESYIPPRVRLSIAVALTVLLVPVVKPMLPALPADPMSLTLLMLNETMVGIFIGLAARLILSGLQVAGTVIAFQSGLGMANFFDPTQGTQGQMVASFLGILGLVLIFATNLHLLMLRAVADSFTVFPPNALPPLGDFARMAVDFVSGSFRLGVQFAAPFIAYGIVFQTGLAVINRLMPQVPVSIVAVPLQIFLAFMLLSVTLAVGMSWFLGYYEAGAAHFLKN